MTDKVDDIYGEIADWGYIIPKPIGTPVPNFYKLGDESVLSVLTRPNMLLKNTLDPNMVDTNFSNIISTFVKKENRNPNGKHPQSAGEILPLTIIDEDMDCTALREEFNAYEMGGAKIMMIKAVVAQVQKTDLYSFAGEPIYNVNVHPIIKFKTK